jgi:hypothetical protein
MPFELVAEVSRVFVFQIEGNNFCRSALRDEVSGGTKAQICEPDVGTFMKVFPKESFELSQRNTGGLCQSARPIVSRLGQTLPILDPSESVPQGHPCPFNRKRASVPLQIKEIAFHIIIECQGSFS